MRCSLARRVIIVLLAQALFVSPILAQQQTSTETRPRRAQPAWPQPVATTPIISSPNLAVVTGPEPKIRVALTTDARSAVISTTGHLLNANGGSSTMLALDTSRVRVDPRLLSPLATTKDDAAFKVIVSGAATHEEAEDLEDVIEKLTSEDGHSALDTETKTWGVVVGSTHPREEAEELRARLEAAGFDARVQGPQQTNTDSVADSSQPAR